MLETPRSEPAFTKTMQIGNDVAVHGKSLLSDRVVRLTGQPHKQPLLISMLNGRSMRTRPRLIPARRAGWIGSSRSHTERRAG
jgi:hypothetical protein